DGRGEGGRARSCANTAIASWKARGRVRGPLPATTAVRACPAPSHHVRRWKAVVMARKRRRAPKYAGPLAQPIYVDQIDRFNEMLSARVPEKIHLLFKHYEIDPSDEQSWLKLTLRLAFDYVPGLQFVLRPRSKVGRKPTWKTGLGDELVRAVQDVMKSQTGMRTQDAIRKLREDKPKTWGRYTIENLGARYKETKRGQERFRRRVEKAQRLRALGRKPFGLSSLLPTDEN